MHSAIFPYFHIVQSQTPSQLHTHTPISAVDYVPLSLSRSHSHVTLQPIPSPTVGNEVNPTHPGMTAISAGTATTPHCVRPAHLPVIPLVGSLPVPQKVINRPMTHIHAPPGSRQTEERAKPADQPAPSVSAGSCMMCRTAIMRNSGTAPLATAIATPTVSSSIPNISKSPPTIQTQIDLYGSAQDCTGNFGAARSLSVQIYTNNITLCRPIQTWHTIALWVK
ncbi:hypothetical protein JVT61DRAFT_11449 [Boletus reticuloceps]|uniref:Uncharacterized protein n=1 Tax=Boletus reticuloceps TaxID=495285 RepID=A0A8I3AE29_9AGAM|nr:hypothetical protein JVT61DRAFT_11449 [Boletus reticuloceps]